MLMATMLLISANVWATTVGTTDAFKAAWALSATQDVVIDLANSNVSLDKTMWLGTEGLNGTAHNVQINLNGEELTLTADYGFLLTHGKLKIVGPGTITASCAKNVFYVTGSTNKDINPSVDGANYFTHLEIGAGVIINHSKYDAAISVDCFKKDAFVQVAQSSYVPSKPALTYATNVYTKPSTSYGVANGARVDLYGTINGQKYGIKTNGNLGSPKTASQGFSNAALTPSGYQIAESDVNYAPFVYVHPGAKVTVLDASSETKKPLALYASGYAHWKIEGKAEGNVGLMVKSGDVDINNATITSTAPSSAVYAGPNNGTSGTSAVGSAIVINSADAYAGDIDVTISGATTVTSEVGYAIDEKVVTTANDTKVETIKIESGTFDGGNKIPDPNNDGQYISGTITISQTTTTAAASTTDATTITVVSATIDGPVEFGTSTVEDPITHEQVPANKLSDFIDENVSVEYKQDASTTVVVPLTVKLNADGYASYSAPIDIYLGTSGLTAYIGKLKANQDELQLTSVNYIKANQGVILKGEEPGATKSLTNASGSAPGDPSIYGVNDLKPSSAWATQTNKDAIYCLRRMNDATVFCQYVGAEMPANKAYLDLNDLQSVPGSAAPARIRMVFEETQDVENIEAGAKAVKFIENGNIFIKRGDKVFNMQGQIVK